MRNKRGQDGKGVAILLLLIALFMVLYMLLLPPEQREDILNETINGGISGEEVETKVLLLETPEYVYPTKESDIEHELRAINLFIKDEPTTNLLVDTLKVSRTLISNKPQTLTFDVEDISNLKDIVLFFSVIDSKGDLIIKINNRVIFDGTTKDVETIKLPVNYIKNDNVLEIRSSSPGIFFWSKNFHSLETVGIKETYQLTNPKEERIFSLPKYEIESLTKARLSYQIYCNDLSKDATNLKIFLNNYNILDKLIGCIGGSESVEIDEKYFKEGNNKMEFTIGEGDFQFSNIEIRTELKERVYPTYHFNINDEDFDFIEEDLAEVNLRLSLSEADRKKAKLMINNKEVILDTSSDDFSRDITNLVNEGDNFIKIVPENTFYIDTLEIKLEEV